MAIAIIAIASIIGAFTALMACEPYVVSCMDECDDLRQEISKPKMNKLRIEIGEGYNESDNVWKL